MAQENALIAKIIGGVSLIGGAGSAGVVYRNEIINKFQDIFVKNAIVEKESYLVVATSIENDLQPSEQISNTPKNFECTTSDPNKKDNLCEIYKLPTDTSTHKLQGIEQIKNSSELPSNDEMKVEGNYFLLKISKDLLTNTSKEKWSGTETISLVSTKDSETNKKYGEFTALYKIEDNKFIGKTNLLLGKAKSSAEGFNSGTIKCKLKNKDTKEKCSMYAFNTKPTGDDYKNFSFQKTFTEITQSSQITENTYFVIYLGKQKYQISDFNKTTAIMFVQAATDAEDKNIAELTFVAALAESQDFPTNSNTFFLN